MILTKIGKKTEHDTKGQDNDPGLGIRSSVLELITQFLRKNEWTMIKWAIHSFLVRDLSDLLTPLIFGEQPELFTHIAH